MRGCLVHRLRRVNGKAGSTWHCNDGVLSWFTYSSQLFTRSWRAGGPVAAGRARDREVSLGSCNRSSMKLCSKNLADHADPFITSTCASLEIKQARRYLKDREQCKGILTGQRRRHASASPAIS